MRERFAEQAHKSWSGWMRYMFSKGYIERLPLDESLGNASPLETVWVMHEESFRRWQRQMNTPYAELPESEKESDRKEADEYLALLDTPSINADMLAALELSLEWLDLVCDEDSDYASDEGVAVAKTIQAAIAQAKGNAQ